MSPNVLNILPGALGSPGGNLILGEVAGPAPTNFLSKMICIAPDWSRDIIFQTIPGGSWPALYGSVLPAVSDDVLLVRDVGGNWRAAWWGTAAGKTTWGGVTLPTSPPSGPNKAIVSNGAGGSSWGIPTLAPLVWHPLPYNTVDSWQDYEPAHTTFKGAQYALDALGFVTVRGLVKKTGPAYGYNTSSAVIGTLPVGFRPDGQEIFTTLQDDGVGNFLINRTDVLLNGNIQIISSAITATGTGNNGIPQFLTLAGIRFAQGN